MTIIESKKLLIDEKFTFDISELTLALEERLFSSDFTFLFESSVNKKEILCEDFLFSIKEKGLMISDMRYLNPLKTLLEHKSHIDSIMYLQGFGNNDQSVEIITKKIESEKFLNTARKYQKKNLLISLN